MNLLDWILILAIAAAVIFALYRIHENKRKGKGCCGQCAVCGNACSHRKFHEK
ncbi:MAG: FeoB-associated Cys-rich membrane protein [Ruthenibacterium sp.]